MDKVLAKLRKYQQLEEVVFEKINFIDNLTPDEYKAFMYIYALGQLALNSEINDAIEQTKTENKC